MSESKPNPKHRMRNTDRWRWLLELLLIAIAAGAAWAKLEATQVLLSKQIESQGTVFRTTHDLLERRVTATEKGLADHEIRQVEIVRNRDRETATIMGTLGRLEERIITLQVDMRDANRRRNITTPTSP